MNNNSFNISFSKALVGSKKSEIQILNGTPDLKDFFYNQNPSENRRFFITDSRVASLECMQEFISLFSDDIYEKDCLIILGSGERYKNSETVLSIVQKALEYDLSKNDCFIAIGGGVVCDLAAFAAAIYKRGIDVKFVPTTMLAMVDASIGGKTSCDFGEYKNMIGTFYPASNIYIFTEFAQFTSEAQYRSGLSVAFKAAFVHDRELYELFRTERDKVLSRDRETIDKIVRKCVKAKVELVEKDPTEKNVLLLLDLGNTFSHALETLIGLGSITQGEAISWGISRAICLSWTKGYCNEAFKDEILELIKSYGGSTEAVHPLVLGGGIGERIISLMHKDKKNTSDKVRLVIPKGIEDVVIEEVEDEDILAILK